MGEQVVVPYFFLQISYFCFNCKTQLNQIICLLDTFFLFSFCQIFFTNKKLPLQSTYFSQQKLSIWLMHKKLSRLKVIVDLENKQADNNNIPVKNRIRHKVDQDLFKKDKKFHQTSNKNIREETCISNMQLLVTINKYQQHATTENQICIR